MAGQQSSDDKVESPKCKDRVSLTLAQEGQVLEPHYLKVDDVPIGRCGGSSHTLKELKSGPPILRPIPKPTPPSRIQPLAPATPVGIARAQLGLN